MPLLAYRVCLANIIEAVKLCDLDYAQLDARFLAITLMQATLQQILC